jgi:hypothetical protein
MEDLRFEGFITCDRIELSPLQVHSRDPSNANCFGVVNAREALTARAAKVKECRQDPR